MGVKLDLVRILSNADPELLRKAHEAFGILIENARVLHGFLGEILNSHQGRTAVDAQEVVPGIDSSRGERVAASPAFIYTKQSEFFDLPQEELERLGRNNLVDIIAKHYHKTRQKPFKIENFEFYDDKLYPLKIAAKALNLKSAASIYASWGGRRPHFENENGEARISGYEIIRIYLRPHAGRTMSEDEFLNRFRISERIYKKLIDLEVIKYTARSLGAPADLLDKIFPSKKDTERYAYLMRLLQEQTTTKSAVSNVTVVAPSQVSPLEILYIDDEKAYVPLSRLATLKEGIDYKLVPATRQDIDAFDIRHRDARALSKKREENVTVNWRDVRRLYLARAFVKEAEIANEFNREGFPYDKGEVIKSLEKAGLSPIAYKGNFVFPSGTLDIATLTDDELERIGKIAKPLIAKHGHFISLRQVKDMVGESFTQTDFLRKKASGITSAIASVIINGEQMYNLFQVVKSYIGVFEKAR